MKKFLLIIIMMVLVFGLFAEGQTDNSAEAEQTRATKQVMNEMQSQIGMPTIINFQERKLAKMIFELRDKEDLVTYAYIVAEQTGQLIFLGKCIGYGIPYSVQYTNPMQMKTGGNSSGYWGTAIPQADPNGLYMPEGLSATWLMIIDPTTGEPRPVYVEPNIIVSPFPLR